METEYQIKSIPTINMNKPLSNPIDFRDDSFYRSSPYISPDDFVSALPVEYLNSSNHNIKYSVKELFGDKPSFSQLYFFILGEFQKEMYSHLRNSHYTNVSDSMIKKNGCWYISHTMY